MKKLTILIVATIIIASLFAKYIDTANVTTGHEPECCIKIVSRDGSKVTYWGPGYKVVRYVGVSPDEPYKNNIGVKMGSWFMKYEKPTNVVLDVKAFGTDNTFKISEKADVDFIVNLLKNSKYINEPCDGIANYAIAYDDYTYDILIDCSEIKRGNKQAEITDKDMNNLQKIIFSYIKNNLTLEDALSFLSEEQFETIVNPDNPKTEEIIFDKEPSVYLYDEKTEFKGRTVIKYTYNTTQDGLLGPITFYTDKETGIVLGSDFRE